MQIDLRTKPGEAGRFSPLIRGDEGSRFSAEERYDGRTSPLHSFRERAELSVRKFPSETSGPEQAATVRRHRSKRRSEPACQSCASSDPWSRSKRCPRQPSWRNSQKVLMRRRVLARKPLPDETQLLVSRSSWSVSRSCLARWWKLPRRVQASAPDVLAELMGLCPRLSGLTNNFITGACFSGTVS